MDSDDGCSIGTASTDTSMFLRELLALNTEGTSGPIAANQSASSDTLKGLATGEEENPDTLPQAMRTLRGDKPAQIVNFSDNIEECSVGIYSPEVEINVSPSGSFQEKAPGSNKVKITPMVNHVWDHKFYYGNLVAVHRDSDFLAYVLKGKSGGNVRIVSRRTAARNLLKCFNGSVMDIAFALCDDVILAAADETGTLIVHSFSMDGDNILSHLILHVERETYNIESVFRNHTRVIWCPFMPDEESDSTSGADIAKMLVLLHGTQAEVWNVEYVSKEKGSEPLSSKNVSTGMMCIEPYEPMMPVVNAAFAPDGSAIAVAYYSGLVKFFLVDLSGEAETGCMHEWNPHDGSPVTSLFFLDDHRHTSPDQQLWKFALTGANYNTEIKIWSCETWACVQSIRFNSPLSQPDLSIQLKSDIDLTSKYLVMSDIYARVLYILYLHQDLSLATAHVSSLSKFSLTQPCVSCAVYDACLKKMKRSADDCHLDEITTGELVDDDDDDDDEVKENGDTHDSDIPGKAASGIQIKMYAIHTKSLQEYLIRYRPESSAPPPNPPSVSSMSQEGTVLRDMLSDVSLDQTETSNDLSNIPLNSSNPVLIPPKSFSTSSPSAPAPAGRGSIGSAKGSDLQGDATHLSASSTSSFTHVTGMNEDLIDSPLSSVDPSSVMSPSSAYSQTPQKPNANHSDNPLPPISSCDDEEEQSTPKNSLGSSRSPKESPRQSLNVSNQSNQDILEDMFTSSWQKQAQKQGAGDSIDSSSTVDKPDERYDEDDQEVAQAMGSTLMSEGFGGPQMEEEEEEEKSPKEEEEEEEEEKVVKRSLEEKRKEAKWPDPPDVSTEAKRLVSEAIQQSSTEEEEEKNEDYDGDEDDENDEAEIEEIVLQGRSEERDTNVFDHNQQISTPMMINSVATEKALSSVENKLSDLTDKLLMQQDLLMSMQKELAGQREVQLQLHRQQVEQQQLQQVASQQPSIHEDISKLEDILVSRMEHSLAQHMHKETQRVQDSLSRSDHQRLTRDKELHSDLVTEMGRSVRDTVSHTLKTEIKQTINPALHRFVEPMKDKIHQEVAQRLSACDNLLKDNISKAVKSRSTMDVLANSVGDVIYQQMQQAYTHTFKASMLPSFTASMEKTVRDVHGIFQQGTKEYQLYLKQNAEFMTKERGKSEDLVKRMEAAEHQFAQSMSHMKNMILTSVKEELSGQLSHAVGSLKDEMVSEIARLVKEEISTAMKDHGATIDNKLTSYLRSAAATPVPGSQEEDVCREKVIRDLRNGNIDVAFQSALSAENLELVLYACEAVSPMNLFSMSPCPLSQPVLLSLISQLATNLNQQFDLKMKFLSDAVMSLDTDNSRTADHIPLVLSSLIRCLEPAIKMLSNEPRKVKEIKMLIMAAKSLIDSRM